MPLVLVVLERFCDDRMTDGGAIRRHHHVRAAQRVGPVEILVTQPLREDHVDRMRSCYGVAVHVLAASPPSTRSHYAEAGPRIFRWPRIHPEHAALARWFEPRRARYDLVMVECIKHLLPLLDLMDVPVVVDLDDIVSEVTKQRRVLARRTGLDVTGSPHLAALPSGLRTVAIRARRLPRLIREDVASALEVTRQRRAEQLAISRASAVLLCSERDRKALGQPAPAVLAPNGVDVRIPRSHANFDTSPRVAFWGMMSYHANADGARWFRRFIVPELAALNERARVVIFGYASDRLGLEPHPSVEVLGFAEDLDAALAEVAVAVVPLRVGGGTRIKIIEAWARGIPVVSTVLGAYGLDVEHGRDALLADDPAEFAIAIDDLLSDETLRARLIANGLDRARSMSWDSTESAVAAAMQRLITAGE